MTKTFKQNLEFWKKEVDATLLEYWSKTGQLPIHRNTWIDGSWRETEKVVKNGGKRLRPAMLLVMYEAASGKDPREIMPVAVAMELLHNFFLIHDDIIDQDNMRHGTATLNAVYRSKAGSFGKSQASHFGDSVALLLGDRLLVESLQVVVNSKLAPEQKRLAHTEFLKMLNTTICGEMLDVMAGFPGDAKIVNEIIKNKTACYTFVTPLTLGARLGGFSEKGVNLIEKFAYQLGEIFQWQDDYLGIFGDEKKLGKPAGSDLREKKPTLLLIKTYQNLAVQEKARLLNLMGRNISPAELKKARDLIIKSGADQWLKNKIIASLGNLKRSIQKSTLPEDAKDILTGLSSRLIDRKN